MVLDAVANFVRGNTDAAVDSSQTTVSVSDASIFPDPSTEGEYNVVIWDAANFPRPDQDGDVEILRVTAIDTGANDLTVTRAQETTTAAAHPDGSAIHLSPTAKMFSDIESEYTASGENFDGEGTSEFSNLQSVSTDDAEINNAPTGNNDALRFEEGAEKGSITADGVDNSTGNSDWGQSEVAQVSVTFDSAFENIPRIAASPDRDQANAATDQWYHNIRNKSTTGFDVTFNQMAAVDQSGTTNAYALTWIATEGR